jgi:hypothetical protein
MRREKLGVALEVVTSKESPDKEMSRRMVPFQDGDSDHRVALNSIAESLEDGQFIELLCEQRNNDGLAAKLQ